MKTAFWSFTEDNLIKHVTWLRKEMTGNSFWCFLQHVLLSGKKKKANRLELIYRLYPDPMKVLDGSRKQEMKSGTVVHIFNSST